MKPLLHHSILGRSLIASILMLSVFVVSSVLLLSVFAHQRAYDEQQSRLELHVYSLLAQVQFDSTVNVPTDYLDARLQEPDSGLMAWINGRGEPPLWRSESFDPVVYKRLMERNTVRSEMGRLSSLLLKDLQYHVVAYPVSWLLEDQAPLNITLYVAETSAPIDEDLSQLRRGLWLGGALFFILIILAQWLVIRWGLKPIKSLVGELSAVENGYQERLTSDAPSELQPLIFGLNLLLSGEVARRDRVANTLGDLAHSLKTPLAVLQNTPISDRTARIVVQEQVSRMDSVIQWQLQRASGRGSNPLSRVAVMPLLERIRATLLTVYSNRDLEITLTGGDLTVRADDADLMEVLGNVLDNACKYGRSHVRVSLSSNGGGVLISVEDDGEGISPALRDLVMRRGLRADQQGHQGQGIGLAVVRDILQSYGGRITLSTSELGGAKVEITLP